MSFDSPKDLCGEIVRSLDNHKAAEIRVIDVHGLTSLADYFVIAEGTSSTQVRSFTDYVEYDLKEQGIEPLRTEGYRNSSWVLMDYGCVVVHVFMQEAREFYNLEHLWKDGVDVDIAEFLENTEK